MRNNHKRKYGVLLHPVSLSSDFSIGDFGKTAYRFVDALHREGIHLWQVLPLTYTGFDNSPYNSLSAFAGNPVMISIFEAVKLFKEHPEVQKVKDRYLAELSRWHKTPKIRYQKSYQVKAELLRELFNLLNGIYKQRKAFKYFEKNNSYWLHSFAVFRILKDRNECKPWIDWAESDRHYSEKLIRETISNYRDEYDFIVFKQYLFHLQWSSIKEYANSRNIQIIGDIPVYVALDSSDVWSNREIFDLSERGLPNSVAGVPPDYFSKTGQLWGNPLYKWDTNKYKLFEWWTKRLNHLSELMDKVRIDHFIGLINYWAIPYGSKTAIEGEWRPGPGNEFIENVLSQANIDILAENLGILTEEVETLRKQNGIPGMKVLQFHFGDDLPNMDKNDYLYTGTHDNDTLLGWLKSSINKNNVQLRDWCLRQGTEEFTEEALYEVLIRAAINSGADNLIIPMQDILGLGSYGRMNTPGTKTGNWGWKMSEKALGSQALSSFMTLVRSFEHSS